METFIELTESISLAGLGLRITLLDEAFVPPGGAFDPDVLSQPGTLSNVENGFGFVGSIGRCSVEWLLADTSAKALRYIPVDKTIPKILARLKQDGVDVWEYGRVDDCRSRMSDSGCSLERTHYEPGIIFISRLLSAIRPPLRRSRTQTPIQIAIFEAAHRVLLGDHLL